MIYAVIDTNVLVSALFTSNMESATVKVASKQGPSLCLLMVALLITPTAVAKLMSVVCLSIP